MSDTDPGKIAGIVTAYRQISGEKIEGDGSADRANQYIEALTTELKRDGFRATFVLSRKMK